MGVGRREGRGDITARLSHEAKKGGGRSRTMRTRVVGGRKAPGGSQAGRKRTQKGREERRKENFYIGFSRMGLRLRLRLRLPRSSWLPTFPAFGTSERRRPRVCV